MNGRDGRGAAGRRACRRRATCCRTAAAGPTATSCSTRRIARLPDRQPAGHRRSADARQRLGDAVGCAARRPGARRTRSSIWRCASLPRETDEQLTSRVLGYAVEHLVALPRSAASARRARRGSNRCCARASPQARTPSQKAVVVRHAAQRRHHARHGRLAAAGVGEEGERRRACRSPKPITRRSRSSSRCGRSTAGATSSKTQLARIENPDRKARFQFVMPALSADPAEREQVVPVAARRQQPPPRAVGARRA